MVVLFGALLWTLLRAGERLREWPPIGWLGGISFGVFLFHNLTLVAVARYLPELAGLPAALLALLMALLTAWLVKKVVEEPVQKRCRSALKALSAGGRQGSGSTLLVPASWLGRVTGLV